jgi:hypothetical protein
MGLLREDPDSEIPFYVLMRNNARKITIGTLVAYGIIFKLMESGQATRRFIRKKSPLIFLRGLLLND